MNTVRSAIITLALALLLWPLAVHAAPATVSGTVTINPPLPVTSNSRAYFYVARVGAASGQFGTFVNQQQVSNQSFAYNFTVPEGSFSAGSTYRLTVYVVNGTREYRAGWIPLSPSGGTQLNFIAGPYSGLLPPEGAGSVVLLIGLILVAITMILVLWRQLRLRRLSLPAGLV